MYGWRARIGLIVPSSNTTMESEFWRLLPEGVTLHTARVRLVRAVPEELKAMAGEAVKAAEDLATAEVDIIVYGCTTGSLLEGVGWEARLREAMERSSGVKVVTTALAVVEALRRLRVRRVAVATPYVEELNRREKRFLEDCGFEVVRMKGLGIERNAEIGRQPPWVAYRLAREVWTREADALFISCTNFRTLEVVEPLERDLGKPVVSSNTASLWLALRELGIGDEVKGIGSLSSL